MSRLQHLYICTYLPQDGDVLMNYVAVFPDTVTPAEVEACSVDVALYLAVRLTRG